MARRRHRPGRHRYFTVPVTDLTITTAQTVSLAELAAALSATTKYVIVAQREAQLAIRKAGFDNRFAY